MTGEDEWLRSFRMVALLALIVFVPGGFHYGFQADGFVGGLMGALKGALLVPVGGLVLLLGGVVVLTLVLGVAGFVAWLFGYGG